MSHERARCLHMEVDFYPMIKKKNSIGKQLTASALYSTTNNASMCSCQNHNMHGTLECSESHTLREVDFLPDVAMTPGYMIS